MFNRWEKGGHILLWWGSLILLQFVCPPLGLPTVELKTTKWEYDHPERASLEMLPVALP